MKKTYFILLLFIAFFNLNAQERELKVVSFNMRNENRGDDNVGNGWQNRYPVIASMILFHDWDIIGTQECKNNQLTDLKKQLPDYDYIGIGRTDGIADGEYSAIFYKTDKFNLLRSGNFWLSETPEVPSTGWDASMHRICTWGEFEVEVNGFRFFAFNLHMDHIGSNSRKYSSELVISKIKEIAGDQAVFLTGDFNVDQNNESYGIITSSGLLYDTFVLSPITYSANGTFNNFDITNTTRQRIDHIFVSKHFTPTRYGVLTDIYWTNANGNPSHSGNFPSETGFVKGTARLPSDHFPVVTGLKY